MGFTFTMRIKRIHHLTVAVRDVERARATFETLFGVHAEPPEAVPAFGVRTRDLSIGEDTLQLVGPIEGDSAVMRFLERRGEGFYNLALEIDDLDAAVAELTRNGVRVSEPVEATPGVRSAFITMAATHGLSIQLIESAAGAATPVAEDIESSDEAAAQRFDDLAEPEPPQGAPAQEAHQAKPELDLTPDEWSDLD